MYDFEEVEKDQTKVDCHATFGLPYDINTAIGLNITKLVTTLVSLAMPQVRRFQLRGYHPRRL